MREREREREREQEKKQQRIYDLLNAETRPKYLCPPYTKQRKKSFTEKKSFLRKRETGRLNKKRKEGFLPAIEEKWNKMSEKFILKACKSF